MTRRHLAAALVVVLVWGVNFVVIEVGLRSTPPILLAALRFTLVAVVGVWFVPRPVLPCTRLVALALGLYVGQFALLFTAMSRGLPAGLAAVVLQSQAVFTVVGAGLLLRERPTRAQFAGVAVASCGLAVIGVERAGSVQAGPFLLAVGAGASWAAGNLVGRRAGVTQGLSLVVWGSVVAAPPLALLAAWQLGPGGVLPAIGRISGSGLLALAYLAVLATVVGYGTWSSLIGRYPPAVVAPFTLLVPPIGLVAAWLALGETPTATELAGSVLVVAGLLLPQVRRGARVRRGPQAPGVRRGARAGRTAGGAPSGRVVGTTSR